jgi:curved DNA-binding protein CbpA
MPNAPPELVKIVRHWWVRQLHPDTGRGDGARMASINAALDVLRVARHNTCVLMK